MANGQVTTVLRYLRKVVALREAEDGTDGQLLARFVADRDEAAFEALVKRHGPMVLGVCRRITGDPHDADDAFQATFLVLVRKAARIRRPERLANWLYGVAYRTAREAKARTARRKARERAVSAALADRRAPGPDPGRDLRPLLDRELARLPEKYRAPVVLCDLEGKSRKEAAGQLALPEGTVSSRLTRARALLRKRLARQGVALSATALAAAVTQAASAEVAAPLAAATAKAATLLAAGHALAAVVSARVSSLTEGVLRTMFISKLRVILIVALAVIGLGVGAVALASQVLPSADSPEAVAPALPAVASNAPAKAPPKPAKKPEACLVVEAFLAAALAGNTDEAVKFIEPGQSTGDIKEFKEMFAAKKVAVVTAYGNDRRGLAITEQVKVVKPNPDGRDTGYLVFSLDKADDRWYIEDIDLESDTSVKDAVKRFLERHKDAKLIFGKAVELPQEE